MPASPSICAFVGLALGWLTCMTCAAVEPLATAGSGHASAVHPLLALSRGDTEPLTLLPGHLLADAPAITDPDDSALARRWTAMLPQAIERLPAEKRERVLALLDAYYAQDASDANVHPWDFLPAPAAAEAVARAAAQAFDHGQMRLALALQNSGPRADAARALMQEPLPHPALPRAIPFPLPSVASLIHGDGWLFGLDPAGRVRWQRHCERQARVIVGTGAALVVETAGVAVIDNDGHARQLPPLPSFAMPWAISDRAAWFVAGTRAWRVVLASQWPSKLPSTLEVSELTLRAPPLGAPLMRGDDAWWLTRDELILTHGVTPVEHLPHLVALSPLAVIEAHPLGAVIRDGAQAWLVADREQTPPLAQGNSWLMAGDPLKARTFVDHTPDGDDLAFRIGVSDPAGSITTFLENAQTPQQRVIAWLAAGRLGNGGAQSALTDLAHQRPDLFITETATSLTLPISAWPLRTTLHAWLMRSELQSPEISIHSDACRVRVRATWPDSTRWWERTWPTRPLLDAPSRTWALTDGAVVIADGADNLVLLDQATGNLILTADVPGDLDPAMVVRYGSARAAMLCDQGRTALIIAQKSVLKIPLTSTGRILRRVGDAVIVVTDAGDLRLP